MMHLHSYKETMIHNETLHPLVQSSVFQKIVFIPETKYTTTMQERRCDITQLKKQIQENNENYRKT